MATFSSAVWRFRSFFTCLSVYLNGGTLSPFPTEAGHDGLGEDFTHQVIDHAVEYVNGQVHTNNCENFWSLLKRGLKGTYVSVEPFHLFRYVDEQAFRYNNRKDMNDSDRFNMVMDQIVGKRLTYKALIGKEEGTPAETV